MSRDFVATVYMGPGAYHFVEVSAEDIIRATQHVVGEMREANLGWRVVRIFEISKEAGDAPFPVEEGYNAAFPGW